MHFYGWKKGLKTGMYYLRTRPAAQAIQFTVDQTALKAANQAKTSQQQNGRPAGAPASFDSAPRSPAGTSSAGTSAPTRQVPVAAPVPVAATAPPAPSASPASDPPASPTHSHYASPAPGQTQKAEDPEPLSLDGEASKVIDPEYAAALQRQKERELAEAKLQCSLENKEACLMCSG